MKLLFICTHNRCRSILAEAITNHFGEGRLIAKSAGSRPVGEVHPLSLQYLADANISTEGLSSQSWDEHESWQADVVITVCDSAAGEACPVWFGQSLKLHWSLVDPSGLQGSEDVIAEAFRKTIGIVQARIETLLTHDLDSMAQQELAATFTALGEQ
jgi:arsenate reductase